MAVTGGDFLMNPPAATPSPSRISGAGNIFTTTPKYLNGQIVGYYHVYADRTVFVPLANKAPSSVAGPVAPAGPVDSGSAAADAELAAQQEASAAFEARRGAIIKNRDDAQLALTESEGRTKRTFGVEDKSDPFSKAALLQQSLQHAKAQTTTSLAARGQLYSGAMQNAQDANANSFEQNSDALTKAYQEALAAIAQRRSDINNTAESQVADANSTALDQLLQSRPQADQVAPDVSVQAETGGDVPVAQSTAAPKRGFKFVQTVGTRKGMSYNIVTKGGKKFKKYANGDVVAAL